MKDRPGSSPPSKPARAIRPPASRRSLRRLPFSEGTPTVLVVDDHRENRDLYREYLTHIGFRVIDAANGAIAIELALSDAPDIIVMDLAMPVMDGFQATRLLKSDRKTRDIPIVVVTATGLEEHRRAAEAGCDVFLVKPCMMDDLEGVLRSCVLLREKSDASDPPSARS